ncbi:UNVERIFIED_ORG: hypothetical protein M2328_005715 [Rhodococcus erythropolis]
MNMPLDVYISHKLGRRVTGVEMQEAVGLGKTTYSERKKSGFSMEEIVKVCEHFHESPTLALIDLGYLNWDDVVYAFAHSDEALERAAITGDPIAISFVHRLRGDTAEQKLNDLLKLNEQMKPEVSDLAARRKMAEPPTYDPTYKPDFSEYDAASHGEKQIIPENGLESP